MMRFFPTPYPDELLYSVLARFHIRSGHMNWIPTLKEIFGRYRSSKSIDLPHDIDNLVSNMPAGSLYTAEELIFKNTLFHFYSAFLDDEKTQRILLSMKNGRNTRIHSIAGAVTGLFKLPTHLRFCPDCFKSDKEAYGETYWHRIHQIPGMFICPVHREQLLDSNIFLSTPYSRYHVADEDSCRIYTPKSLDSDTFNKLLNLSGDIMWLMENSPILDGKNSIHQRYKSLLFKNGFSSVTGKIYNKKLTGCFMEYYGDTFLQYIQNVNSIMLMSWLGKIYWNQNQSIHPTAHLLFIRFLSGSIQEFVRDSYEYKPFGDGPWPCLNPVSDHYRQPVIDKIEIGTHSYQKSVTGTFKCSCGFIYSRRGPDGENDRYRAGNIIEYGSLWGSKLKHYLEVEKLSFSKTADLMGITYGTVLRQAGILGIYTSSNCKLYKPGVDKKAGKHNELKRNEMRKEWLMIQEKNPEACRRKLRELVTRTYMWLYLYDKEWYFNNSPPKNLNRSYEYPDSFKTAERSKKDEEVFGKLKKAYEGIINSQDKPERITANMLVRKAEVKNGILRSLSTLPRTKQFLESVFETKKDYHERKIKWCLEYLNRNGIKISTYRIARAVSLDYDEIKPFESLISDYIKII